MNLHRFIGIAVLVLLLGTGCARYDASQVEPTEPLGSPPLVDLTGAGIVTRPDSLVVQAHVIPGEFEIADWAFGSASGEVIQSRLLRVLPERIDLEATIAFPRLGSTWVWVHVWDTEEQTDTDSLAVTIR